MSEAESRKVGPTDVTDGAAVVPEPNQEVIRLFKDGLEQVLKGSKQISVFLESEPAREEGYRDSDALAPHISNGALALRTALELWMHSVQFGKMAAMAAGAGSTVKESSVCIIGPGGRSGPPSAASDMFDLYRKLLGGSGPSLPSPERDSDSDSPEDGKPRLDDDDPWDKKE